MTRRTQRHATAPAADRQANPLRPRRRISSRAGLTVRLRVPSDQAHRLPYGASFAQLPAGMPVPRVGDVLTLQNRTLWAVTVVLHQWHMEAGPNLELCLEALDGDRPAAPAAARPPLH